MAYVFKTSLLAVLLLVPVSFTSVQAADEFGPRFTNMAPAALGGSESDALVAAQDIEDFSAEDLNAIAPAAGGDMLDGHQVVPAEERTGKEDRPVNENAPDTLSE